ncbi:MAG: 4Fe-4S binding protein [Deltaproteobacteria bacterium]|nr:4Fe-4S binding protein [Deltaproteobacteria bacterium]
MIKVDIDKCVGCGGCIDLCPATAINLCLECETCVKVCPVKAPQIV